MKNRDFITCIQSVLQLMDEGVHIVDTEGRSIVYNRAMARLEKMETRDVLRKPFSEVFCFQMPRLQRVITLSASTIGPSKA